MVFDEPNMAAPLVSVTILFLPEVIVSTVLIVIFDKPIIKLLVVSVSELDLPQTKFCSDRRDV